MLIQWGLISQFIIQAFSAFFDGLLTPVTIAELFFEFVTFLNPLSDLAWFEFEAFVIDFLYAGSWASFFGVAGTATEIVVRILFEYEFYPMLLISPVVFFVAIAIKLWRLILDIIPIL